MNTTERTTIERLLFSVERLLDKWDHEIGLKRFDPEVLNLYIDALAVRLKRVGWAVWEAQNRKDRRTLSYTVRLDRLENRSKALYRRSVSVLR